MHFPPPFFFLHESQQVEGEKKMNQVQCRFGFGFFSLKEQPGFLLCKTMQVLCRVTILLSVSTKEDNLWFSAAFPTPTMCTVWLLSLTPEAGVLKCYCVYLCKK